MGESSRFDIFGDVHPLSSSLKLNAVPWDGDGAGSTDMHHAK